MVSPLIAAAVIGAGASLAGSAINSKATKKASEAATEAARLNNAEAKAARDQISGYVSPYMPGAYAANDAIAQALGIGGGGGGGAGGNMLAPSNDDAVYDAYGAANSDLQAEWGRVQGDPRFQDDDDYYRWHYNEYGKDEGRALPSAGPAKPPGGFAGTSPAETGSIYGPPVADAPTFGPRNLLARPEFGSAPSLPNINPDQYRESDQAKFLLNQGNRNMRAGAAAGGLGQSGAALKEAISFGQGVASQDYDKWVGNMLGMYDRNVGQFNINRDVANRNYDVDQTRADARYDTDRGFTYGAALDQRNYDTSRFDTRVGNLFNVSNQGLAAAGTLSGAATNYANMVANNNNSAATATGNAAIAGANSTNNLLGQGLQGLGYIYGNKWGS